MNSTITTTDYPYLIHLGREFQGLARLSFIIRNEAYTLLGSHGPTVEIFPAEIVLGLEWLTGLIDGRHQSRVIEARCLSNKGWPELIRANVELTTRERMHASYRLMVLSSRQLG